MKRDESLMWGRLWNAFDYAPVYEDEAPPEDEEKAA